MNIQEESANEQSLKQVPGSKSVNFKSHSLLAKKQGGMSVGRLSLDFLRHKVDKETIKSLESFQFKKPTEEVKKDNYDLIKFSKRKSTKSNSFLLKGVWFVTLLICLSCIIISLIKYNEDIIGISNDIYFGFQDYYIQYKNLST